MTPQSQNAFCLKLYDDGQSTNQLGDSGQTVFHVHVHLIPRRDGDVVDPRGGVRGVIPSMQRY